MAEIYRSTKTTSDADAICGPVRFLAVVVKWVRGRHLHVGIGLSLFYNATMMIVIVTLAQSYREIIIAFELTAIYLQTLSVDQYRILCII